MAAANSRGKHRALVLTLASSRPFCRVCDGLGRVRLVGLPGLAQVQGRGVATCPHCRPEPGRQPLPLYLYPLRDDQPRGAA